MKSNNRTGQTVHQAYYELAKAQDNLWYWCLWSKNNRQMACSPIGYKDRNAAANAIQAAAETMRARLPVMTAKDEPGTTPEPPSPDEPI